MCIATSQSLQSRARGLRLGQSDRQREPHGRGDQGQGRMAPSAGALPRPARRLLHGVRQLRLLLPRQSRGQRTAHAILLRLPPADPDLCADPLASTAEATDTLVLVLGAGLRRRPGELSGCQGVPVLVHHQRNAAGLLDRRMGHHTHLVRARHQIFFLAISGGRDLRGRAGPCAPFRCKISR